MAREVNTVAALAAALALATACVDTSHFDEGDASTADDATTTPCTEGDTRCFGASYQVCQGGSYVEIKKCELPQVCADGLGCAACDPAEKRGCLGRFVHECLPGGVLGNKLKDCLGLPCVAGECRDPACAVGSRLIYVVDDTYRLLSFDPAQEKDHFKLIAKLQCPASAPWPWRPAPATPFSMSVDRSARAWVLYSSGEIFFVDTADGKCRASPYQRGQAGYKLFGMGFVTDAKGSSKEKLFIAGASNEQSPKKYGHITPATLKITEVGPTAVAEYSPELTGTGNGELYAYYPGTTSSFVARVDKSTGKTVKQWPVTTPGGQVTAWAFAHWGGKFYIFVTTSSGLSEQSRVLRLDPGSGQSTTYLSSIPYKIVGAGVSTCAPVID